MKDNKFLIHFVHSLTKKDVFIAIWLLGGALFAYLFLNYQKKSNQRNFRATPSDERGGSLTVKRDNPVVKGQEPKNHS